jgi:hypothetical protein
MAVVSTLPLNSWELWNVCRWISSSRKILHNIYVDAKLAIPNIVCMPAAANNTYLAGVYATFLVSTTGKWHLSWKANRVDADEQTVKFNSCNDHHGRCRVSEALGFKKWFVQDLLQGRHILFCVLIWCVYSSPSLVFNPNLMICTSHSSS